jgi:hypothetical protein
VVAIHCYLEGLEKLNEIKKGTLHSILKKAGLSFEDLKRLV